MIEKKVAVLKAYVIDRGIVTKEDAHVQAFDAFDKQRAFECEIAAMMLGWYPDCTILLHWEDSPYSTAYTMCGDKVAIQFYVTGVPFTSQSVSFCELKARSEA